MSKYLEFRNARCKDCYKCLRECPVKAIDVKGHQAEIIEDRCILCAATARWLVPKMRRSFTANWKK